MSATAVLKIVAEVETESAEERLSYHVAEALEAAREVAATKGRNVASPGEQDLPFFERKANSWLGILELLATDVCGVV